MQRICVCALLLGALCVSAQAEPLQITPQAYAASRSWDAAMAAPAATKPQPPQPQPSLIGQGALAANVSDDAQPYTAAPARPNLGGGFIQFLFGGAARQAPPRADQPQLTPQATATPDSSADGYAPSSTGDMDHPAVDPKFDRQEVAYDGREAPGTIVIDTPNHFLYLIEAGGKAMRYGIGVGRPGFTWSGVKTITAKHEWPDWVPPPEMLQRQPALPRFMAGGPDNPLGARAMYLGSTLYRIHGSNEPWTIGTDVSSGCIRLRNADIEDLYSRVQVGTKVVVM